MAESLRKLADGVWVFPFNTERVEPNVGIVCTPAQTVLIDSGNSPKHAQRILEALKDINAPPITFVICTHHHWDHTFGAAEFQALTVAHESCPELLLDELEYQKRENPFLESGAAPTAKAIGSWDNLRIVIPTITFSQKADLHLDGTTIMLEYVGGRHAVDSVVVRIKERGVMFLGDSFYPPPLRSRRPDSSFDFALLESFLEDAFQVYVDGHNSPKDIGWIRRWLNGNR